MKNYEMRITQKERLSRKAGIIIAFAVCMFLCAGVQAAEYNGRDIDGELFDCTAFSYDTGNYYYVQVEFDGDDAILYFPNGGRVVLTLDDEEIGDPNSISAFDYRKSVFWDLEVNGLD